MTAIVTNILSLLTIVGQVLIVIILFYLIFCNTHIQDHWILKKLWQHGLLFSFIVALTSMVGSLFYSEIAKYDPCKLCWWQRIFMYPQAFLLGIALWKKDANIALYSIALSVMGAIIAGYHYLLQLNIVPAIPCSAMGYSVACAKRFVLNYGYVTIPLMTFTAFILIALFSYASMRKRGEIKGLFEKLSAMINS